MSGAYDDWVTYCFESAYAVFHGKAEPPGEGEPLTDAALADYLIHLFENPEAIGKRFSRDQIADGIWYIFGVSEYFKSIRNASVPRLSQVRCYRAMKALYRQLFDPLCQPLGDKLSMEAINADRLEGAVYMIWDMDCVEGAAMWPEFDYLVGPCFEVIAAALDCRSAACKVSALHALGHIQHYQPQMVEVLAGRFVKKSGIPRWIREYAEAARTGCVQ